MAAAAPSRCNTCNTFSGVGKTTLIIRVLQSLKNAYPNLKVQGFYTREIREGNERIGFEVVTVDGRTVPLASNIISRAESLKWPMVGRCRVDVASFESFISFARVAVARLRNQVESEVSH